MNPRPGDAMSEGHAETVREALGTHPMATHPLHAKALAALTALEQENATAHDWLGAAAKELKEKDEEVARLTSIEPSVVLERYHFDPVFHAQVEILRRAALNTQPVSPRKQYPCTADTCPACGTQDPKWHLNGCKAHPQPTEERGPDPQSVDPELAALIDPQPTESGE